jgi:hypothetical protein
MTFSKLALICTCDHFDAARHPDRAAMIGSILDRIKELGRGDGWQGTRLHDAIWIEGAKGEPDQAVITLAPADIGDVTTADVRALIGAKLLELKRQAEKQQQAHEGGRLF